MRLFRRKKPTTSTKHLNAEEVARITLYHRQANGWGYRDGVIDEAVRRAHGKNTVDEFIDAIESAFVEYQLIRWFTLPSPSFVAAFTHLGVLGCEAA